MDNSGSAFPSLWRKERLGTPTIYEMGGGLTKREYFAAMAMLGLVGRIVSADEVAKLAFIQADVMLAEGGK
jgi:hypothetical protein